MAKLNDNRLYLVFSEGSKGITVLTLKEASFLRTPFVDVDWKPVFRNDSRYKATLEVEKFELSFRPDDKVARKIERLLKKVTTFTGERNGQ